MNDATTTTGTVPTVIVHADDDTLAAAVAARLAVRLIDVLAVRDSASVVLTGGRIAEKIYSALRASAVREAIDWSSVDLWWGDERFLPAGDPDRNETQARSALLDALPLDAARVHPMPAPDGPDGPDPDAGSTRYASQLAAAADRDGTGGSVPRFDVVLLGIGEDGHVASCFPGHAVADQAGPVAAVIDSPKPPPVRTTLTLPALNTADEVWIIASGDGKADAVAAALSGTGSVPAGRVHGTNRTLWLIDVGAASEIDNNAIPATT